MSAPQTDRFRLDGRLAVVTGARRGIGLALAVALAAAGADIVGVSAHLEQENSDAERLVRAHGRRFHARPCDFADRLAVEALASELAQWDQPIDILVNNAGTIFRSPAESYPLSEWDRL